MADLHRRCPPCLTQISQKCNERYLEALAPVESTTPLGQATETVCQWTTFHGRSALALNPLAESDARLLQAICRGEFALHGFRNRDLCERLLADETSLDKSQKRQRITRLIRLLRAHSLVQNIPKTHRDQLTPHAPETLTALLAGRGADLKILTKLAA